MKNGVLKRAIKELVYTWGSRSARVQCLKRALWKYDRLHAGCGAYRVQGWLNVELMPLCEVPYGRPIRNNDMTLLSFDLTKGIPVDDNQISFLYSSHFIEHLSLYEGRNFLVEAFRVIRPGGKMRISCPALDLYVQHYTLGDKEFFNRVYEAGKSFDGLMTPGQIMMGQIHGWGHKWIYDHEGMEHELSKAGFRNIRRSSFREGDFPDLDKIEPSGDAREIQSLYMEAIK